MEYPIDEKRIWKTINRKRMTAVANHCPCFASMFSTWKYHKVYYLCEWELHLEYGQNSAVRTSDPASTRCENYRRIISAAMI
jgi:hypothetical protein